MTIPSIRQDEEHLSANTIELVSGNMSISIANRETDEIDAEVVAVARLVFLADKLYAELMRTHEGLVGFAHRPFGSCGCRQEAALKEAVL